MRLDTAVLDFLSRKLLSLPMTYFTSRRTGEHSTPACWGDRSATILPSKQGVGAFAGSSLFLVGAVLLMGMYSPLLTLAFSLATDASLWSD